MASAGVARKMASKGSGVLVGGVDGPVGFVAGDGGDGGVAAEPVGRDGGDQAVDEGAEAGAEGGEDGG